jgi:hypothetical protein
MDSSAQRRPQARCRIFDATKVASVTSLFILGACADININGPNWGSDGDVDHVWNTDHAVEAEFTRDIGAAGTLVLSGVAGSVEIVGSGGGQGIVVEAVRRVRSQSMEDALAHLHELTVAVRVSGGVAFVETRQPDRSGGRKYEVEYRIQVPGATNVTAAHAAGPVEVRSLSGDVGVEVAAGAVKLVDLTGDVRAAVGAGDTDASVTLPPHGRVELRVGAGSIVLSVPTETSASVRAVTAAGAIRPVDLVLVDQDPRASVLQATMGGGDGTIRLEAAAGDITIKGR